MTGEHVLVVGVAQIDLSSDPIEVRRRVVVVPRVERVVMAAASYSSLDLLAVEVAVAAAGGACEGLDGALLTARHELPAPVHSCSAHRGRVVLHALSVPHHHPVAAPVVVLAAVADHHVVLLVLQWPIDGRARWVVGVDVRWGVMVVMVAVKHVALPSTTTATSSSVDGGAAQWGRDRDRDIPFLGWDWDIHTSTSLSNDKERNSARQDKTRLS